jgi:dipeptidase E
MFWLKKSGLAEVLPEFLKTKVYVGISAGSMVTCPSIALSNKDKKVYYEKWTGYGSEEGLGLVNFYFRPHLNTRFFPNANSDTFQEIAKTIKEPIYALDDESALQVIDGSVKIVSEGEYLVFNKKDE